MYIGFICGSSIVNCIINLFRPNWLRFLNWMVGKMHWIYGGKIDTFPSSSRDLIVPPFVLLWPASSLTNRVLAVIFVFLIDTACLECVWCTFGCSSYLFARNLSHRTNRLSHKYSREITWLTQLDECIVQASSSSRSCRARLCVCMWHARGALCEDRIGALSSRISSIVYRCVGCLPYVCVGVDVVFASR